MKLFTVLFVIAFAVIFVEARNLQVPKKFDGSHGFEKPKGFGKLPVAGHSKHFGGRGKDHPEHDRQLEPPSEHASVHGGLPQVPKKPAVSTSTVRPTTTTTVAPPSAASSSSAGRTFPLSPLAQWCYEQAMTNLCRYIVA